MQASVRVGSKGEKAACHHLRMRGYHLLGHNVHLGHCEIDIVAHDPRDDVIVFVEVKTRSIEDSDYWPTLNLTHEKKRAMRLAARRWVTLHDYDQGWRMDIICVISGKVVDHIEQVGWGDD